MDEKQKQIDSKNNPGRALDKIDETLASAYPAPRKIGFSSDKDTEALQKAVLYHRIRENASLRSGQKSVTNDIRYEQLATAITENRDAVAEFIKGQPKEEQSHLLRELTASDQHMPWFEQMITKAEEKKAELNNITKQDKLPDAMNAETLSCQSKLYRSLAENRNAYPREFLSKPENLASMRRLIAVELHRNQLEKELKEYEEALRYESSETREQLLNNRPPFSFEKEAAENLTEYLNRLEASPEVTAVLHRMTKTTFIEELGRLTENPPSPGYLHQHDSIGLMDNKMVPGAIAAFLSGEDAPEESSSLYKALMELTDEKRKKLPDAPTEEECEKRIKEYQAAIKTLDKSEFASKENGIELKKVLEGQIDRLQDVALSKSRENVPITFRADTLIDYIDVNDPERKPMNAIEAREKLLRGAELEQITYADGEFVGTSKRVTFDKKTGLINKGPEKLITRVMNLSEKAGRKPELQLEELRKIKDVLKKTDPFYVKNSENYTAVLTSLNKVIKAQESLDKDANVRQVAELRALYAELDSNAAKYVKDKADRLKTGDDRAQIRMDAIKTLQSLTGERHVGRVTLKQYDEQKKWDDQQLMVKPCKKIMDKWKRRGTPTTPEGMKEFQKDFDNISERIETVQKGYGDTPYFKMGMAQAELGEFTKQAEQVQKQQKEASERISNGRLNAMKAFAQQSEASLKLLYAMDATAAPRREAQPEKEVQNKSLEKANEPVMK